MFRDKQNTIHPQDTTLLKQKADTLSISIEPDRLIQQKDQDTAANTKDTDTLSTLKKYSLNEIQSILNRSEQRLEQIDSTRNVKTQGILIMTAKTAASETGFHLDSNHIIFSFDSAETSIDPNFLSDLSVTPLKEYEYAQDLYVYKTHEAETFEKQNGSSVAIDKHTDQLFHEIKQTVTSDNWIIGIILFSFIILAWIRLFYNKLLVPTFQSFFNYQLSYSLFNDRSSRSLKASSGLNFIFYLNAGLFLYLVLNYFDISFLNVSGIITYFSYAGFLIITYAFKRIICSFTGYISLTQKVFSEYIHNVFLFNRNLGLFLFPFLIGISYMSDSLTPVFVYTGIGVVVSLYLLRIFRGITIFFNAGFSIFYLILYLCALEFLPLILFFRLFQFFIK
jgi:hypothetical protein